ncbi:MAG: hypothetical protein ACLGHF_08460 [Alphaproteobacteria bacterium]
MKYFKKSVLLAATAALGLGVAACDSRQENAQENAAQDVREASDAAADAMETQADAVRETGDAKADKMEDQADKKDTTPE